MAKVLIIGYGDIGKAVAIALAEDGHDVAALRRTKQIEDSKVKVLQADVSNTESLSELDLDVDQVVYILSPSGGSTSAYKEVFDLGVHNVLDVFKKQCPNAAITFVSSTRVYGQNNGEWVDERSITEPADDRGRLLLEAEKAFLAFNDKTSIVRFSGIYGRSNYFLNQIKSGVKIQKSPPYYTNRIHRSDCIGVLAFLVNKKANGVSMGGVYTATDSDPAAKWEVASYLAAGLNVQCEEVTNLNTDAKQNKRIKNKRLIDSGYVFKYPSYQQGYGESLE